MLNTIQTGDPGPHPPVLIAHGLFGSARNWGTIAKRLAASGRRVIAVDMRNHGDSPRAASQSYPDMAADLAEVIEGLDGPADVLGHSMGGKAAMVLALSRPELVRRLIVADIAPVAYGHTQAHLIAAMRGVDLDAIANRTEAAAQLDVTDPATAAFLLQSLDLGRRRWKLDLDVLDRDMPLILGFPEVAGSFDGPVLFLTGATSDYVVPAHRARIDALFPAATQVRIPGAGHWLHADRPREVVAEVLAFLN